MTTVLVDEIGSYALADRAGVSYRRVDHWTRSGLFEAIGPPTPGSGIARQYRSREIAVARFLALVAPWKDVPGGQLTSGRVRDICELIRLGERGTISLVDGVTVDLDLVCGE